MGWLLGVLALATVFWLGYATGRTMNVAEVLRLQRDADVDRYTLMYGGTMVQYERLGGGGKPSVLLADGLPVVELSDWDPQSRVVVDGASFELARLYPQSAVDYARHRVAQTLHGQGWQLEREISLEPDGTVQVQHSFIARRPIQRVDLALAHVRAYFLKVEAREGAAVLAFNRLPREQLEAGVTAPASHRLELVLEGGRLRPHDVQRAGTLSLVVEFSTDNPARDQRVTLGRESLRVSVVQP